MAEELLDRILREVRERMRVSRAAVEETRRLKSALAALGDGSAPEASARGSRGSSPRRAGSGRSGRARRGENLRPIREAVEQRPGASAGEVAAATGIARATVAATLGKLARAGELEKRELPGRVGYRQPRDHSAEHAESAPAPEDSKPDASQETATPSVSAAADG